MMEVFIPLWVLTILKISVSEKSKLDIYLEFKTYEFNAPLTYTFPIPKNYKVKQQSKKK